MDAPGAFKLFRRPRRLSEQAQARETQPQSCLPSIVVLRPSRFIFRPFVHFFCLCGLSPFPWRTKYICPSFFFFLGDCQTKKKREIVCASPYTRPCNNDHFADASLSFFCLSWRCFLLLFCMVAGRCPPTTPNNKCDIAQTYSTHSFGLWPIRDLLKPGQKKEGKKDIATVAQQESGACNRERETRTHTHTHTKKKSVRAGVGGARPRRRGSASAHGVRSTLGALKHIARWRKGTPAAAFLRPPRPPARPPRLFFFSKKAKFLFFALFWCWLPDKHNNSVKR
nr:hypothetical protein [Pandoravirus aubagnensis]